MSAIKYKHILRCHKCGTIIYRYAYLDYEISLFKSLNEKGDYLLKCSCDAELKFKGGKTQFSNFSWKSR